MHRFIPYGRQFIDDDDIQAVVDVLKGDYLTTGPKIHEFEEALAARAGAKYAVAVSNGTAALHAACFAVGICEGDEVITSPITFAASANCALYVGAKPVFADIDSRTYNIDPDSILQKINSRTKALIPVHYTGQPCDMDAIRKVADKYGLIVIEDASHALGATYKGKAIGGISDMSTFSFHPVKQITTGEGGAVTTNDEKLYKRLLLFRSHGQTRNREWMEKYEGDWYYEQQELGYNYRMTDIQAALGLSQMKKLDMFLERRRELAAIYNESFKDVKELKIPEQLEVVQSAWHLYVISLRLDRTGKTRFDAFNYMKSRNIGVNVHYIPVYYHPYYRRLGYAKGICPNAESLYESLITLPLYPGMNDEDAGYAAECLKEAISKPV